jgi:hypothetical protein
MEGCIMITLSGLTPKQKALMTVMWDIDSVDKVQEFIGTLPAADARDAHCLLKLAIWESCEQQGELDAYKDHATTAIRTASRL